MNLTAVRHYCKHYKGANQVILTIVLGGQTPAILKAGFKPRLSNQKKTTWPFPQIQMSGFPLKLYH